MENELIVRLVECAKPLQSTTDVVGWEDTTSIPKKGEICLEYYTETSAGDIDYGKVCYKMKIGDGVSSYANLPYFPTTKDINAKIAAWVNAHLNVTDYAQASIDTTTKTLTIQGIGETGGIIHQAESFALQFVEGNKIDITVQKSNNLSSTVTIAHEATTTTESTGTKREFGGSVVTGLTLDSMGHIINIEKSALPDNPVDANTVTASNNLPENEVVLGNGTKTIKSSGKTITTTAPTSTSTDSTIPTSKAVDTAIDTKINALDSEVNADTNKVLTGVTQTDGKLTTKADVSYTDIAPVQNVKSGNHITVSNSNNEYTVNHASIGTGSAITPTTDGNTGWEGDVVTTVERDTYGHISGVKTKKIPSNPVSAGSTTTNQLMKSDGDSTTSPSGFTASNGNINESGSTNSTTLPTTSAIVTYVQDKMGDLAGALIYKGTVNSASDLPNNPTTGWMYVVATAGTYAGKSCEVGDYLIYNGSSWDVINGENQVDDKNATLPWNTQTTIAEVDGTAIHVTLPENPVNSLDATNKGAASISGSTITIKAVSQNNGLIDDGDSTTINLDGTYNATNNKIATQTTVSDAVDTAVNDLDVDAYSQATVNTTSVQGQTTLTIKGIKEVNGRIAADNTTNIKTDILIDGTYSNDNKLATQSTVNTAVTNAINNLDESEDIGAMAFNPTEQSITVKAVQQEDGKIKDGGSTVIKLGDGLTATVDTSNNNVVSVDSDSIVAGDIKDPDIYSDSNDWTYRQTADSSTEAAGTDVAKLNPLKGNTIVWNQLVQNGNFVNSEGWYKEGASAIFTVNSGVATFTANAQYQYISYSTNKAVDTHKYLISIKVKRASTNSASYSFGLGAGGSFTYEGLYTVISLSNTSTTDFTSIYRIGTFNKAEGYTYPQFIIMQMSGPRDAIMIKNVQLIDLTKMFGSDEQIAAALGITVAEITTDKAVQAFEKLFPLPYYNYNEGELTSLGGNPQIDPSLYVDMGLPSGILWAKSNIDLTQPNKFAASPYQYGCSFFSWGNIDGHNPVGNSFAGVYNWGGVNAAEPWYDGQVYGNTKGNTLTGNIPVGEEFDAVRANLGSPWRMPTTAEFAELFAGSIYIDATGTEIPAATTDKRVTVNGIVGLYLQSKANGNRLFFSASGYGADSSWYSRGAGGSYWSASFGSARGARNLGFVSGGVYPQNTYGRCGGFAVRPVLSNNSNFSIKSTGFNQWDEEWELGTIDDATGGKSSASDRIRSKNYIPVFSGQTYYAKNPLNMVVHFYDAEKGWISKTNGLNNTTFDIPTNAKFIRFRMIPSYGTTYNNDICINISDSSRNGTYEPYKKHTLDLDWIKTLKDSGGNLLFPNGLCSAGSVYDEVGEDYAIKRVGAVDLGTLTYFSQFSVLGATFSGYKTPSSSGLLANCVCGIYNTDTVNNITTNARVNKTIGLSAGNAVYVYDTSLTVDQQGHVIGLDGVMLYYELATPITIHFNKKSMYYVVDDKGTEQLLPVNDADPITAPIRGQVDYHSNIKEVVKDLIDTSSGDTYTLTSNKASSSSTNDASITLTDSNGNKQSITVPFSVIRNDENITIILNGNF